MIGLGAIRPNQLCLITGSSHLHCLVTPEPVSKSGMWGAYRGAPLPNLSFAEGGQSSTGRLLLWLRDLVSGEDKISYKILDEEASKIDPGSDGLVALETW
jgi:ribulose kinase